MSMKLTYEFVKQSFENAGYQLLSTEYINAQEKLNYICLNGHYGKIKYGNWQQGQRCPCQSNIRNRYTYEKVKQSFGCEGYQLVSTEYKGVYVYLEFICPNGHRRKITWSNWLRGRRCGLCKPKYSKPEKEILEYIQTNYNGIVKENDRTLIQNPKTGQYLELDIWLPELNKAIEYGADHWHSEPGQKWRDNYKRQWCKEYGIDLMVIDEKIWIKNKDWNTINKFVNMEKI